MYNELLFSHACLYCLSYVSCNEVQKKLSIRFHPKSTSRHKTREIKYAEYKNTKSKVCVLHCLVADDRCDVIESKNIILAWVLHYTRLELHLL